ncbi:putative sugar kinase [Thioflavicoccus mobilis 8321]|uniref:NAD kinase n=1 Tax=Thioflavicoccus mobilis 8321 TaxID=765912 RepID=L0GWX2_9GAMM|nr:NAD(+) kinase [Thioflavicoccus mobilis]AGA91263.1 putative sugar kinase [Thioflavicoccus mobilis 8321]
MALFPTIGIIAKHQDAAQVQTTLERLVRYLRARSRELLFDPASAAVLAAPTEQVLDATALGMRCDLAIVVGGDGTFLTAARALAPHGVPLVGINLGRLGFLVDVLPNEIEEALERILDGEYDEEARCMLAARVGEDDGADWCFALNDVVVHKWNTARMIELETRIDGALVNVQRSDGLVVATPTGSTAYALSGGGPLLHPSLDALVMVPICPHTLSNRPLVVTGQVRIEIRVHEGDRHHVRVTRDGQTNESPLRHDRIFIEQAPHPARLLHPKGHDHYAILRAKLGWGGHPHGARRC